MVAGLIAGLGGDRPVPRRFLLGVKPASKVPRSFQPSRRGQEAGARGECDMSGLRGHGRFQATGEAFGFIAPERGGEDLFVAPRATGGALHGDRVEYVITREAARGLKAEAAIVAVLERGLRHFTGVIAGSSRRLHLVPDHSLLPPVMRLLGNLHGIECGQRVLCSLHEAPGGKPPGGLLVRILGDADDPLLDAEIVRTQFGLPDPFPDELLAEARAVKPAAGFGPEAARRDFTGELVITIDPPDAHDFDDAVSLRAAPGGLWLLRVHIADVADAVAQGSGLDAEAGRRGNTTYLPGLVIPMLPNILSTDRMSLAPGKAKRVISISVRVERSGRIRAFRIEEGLIRSRQRLNYEQVQAVLDGKGSVSTAVDSMLQQMDGLAVALRSRRFGHGGFELQVPEIQVVLDRSGRPIRIERRRQGRSHRIIEEFMILANRAACAFATGRGHPYIYRVHPPPDPVAIEKFCADVQTLAPEVSGSALKDLSSLRRWLASLPAEPRTWRIHALFLRAFMHALYADRDGGHFGLGLRGYGHFTSPIRRYPDLFNHRIVKWAIRHGRRSIPAAWRHEAAGIAEACSESEERSERAERELVRIKSLRWAQARLGSSFRGAVVAILPRGLFVELETAPIDGFVSRTDAEAMAAQGRYPGPRLGSGRGGLQVGGPVIVQIARVDMRERALTFAIRAVGRRALDTDPERMEPLVDPWRRAGPAPKRRGGRSKPGRQARGRDARPLRRSRRRKGQSRR